MNNVPAGAAALFAFLRRVETGRDGAAQYRTIIGHREDELPKPLTEYTVDELLAAQVGWGRKWGSSAAGAYQIIRKTLAGLKKSMGVAGSEKFSPALQDWMGYELAKGRGLVRFLSGQMSRDAFALELAKEWASMPVLKATKGATRQLKRGQSYYAGDGLNKALVPPEELEAVLDSILETPVPRPADMRPEVVDPETVALVQRRLRELGYTEVGNVDGIMGPLTENAILIFRKDHGLPLSSRIDGSLKDRLFDGTAKPRVLGRKQAEPEDVRKHVPEARNSWWTKVAAVWGMIAAGATGAVDFVLGNLSGARSMVDQIKLLFGAVPLPIYLLLIGGFLFFIWFKSQAGEKASVDAYQKGARR